MKKKLKMENKLSIGAIIISVLSLLSSLIIAIVQYNYQVETDIKNEKEDIAIIFSSIKYDSDAIFSRSMIGGFLSGIKYEVIICNNSKQKISIVDSELFLQQGESFIQYKDILRDIYDASGKVISFPLSLEPGESRKVVLDVTTLIVDINKDWKIGDEYKEGSLFYIEYFAEKPLDGTTNELVNVPVNFSELKKFLKEENLDIYGNNLDIKNYGGAELITILNPQFPVYRFEVMTSKGNKFYEYITQNSE